MRHLRTAAHAAWMVGLLAAPPAHADVCTDAWDLKDGETALLYPDIYASYLVYHFVVEPGTALRLTGPFAAARFQNFTLYEDVNAALVAKMPDVEILPDAGSVNPYLPGVDRAAPNRDYTLWLAPEGSRAAAEPNSLPFAPDLTVLSLIMRVYLPDPGTDPVGLGTPTLEAVDADDLGPAPCPAGHHETGFVPGAGMDLPGSSDDIRFYRVAGSNAYPSYDSTYLAAPLNPAAGDVAVLWFTPPTYTETSSGGGSFSGEEEVRYWSLCLSRLDTTTTPGCVADQELPIDPTGAVHVVFAPPTLANRRAARRAGWPLVPWSQAVDEPLLIYRNILEAPGFSGGADDVPPYTADQPAEAQHAEVFIGDHAPRGVLCTSAELQADLCGQRP